jgi:hypothetical protein
MTPSNKRGIELSVNFIVMVILGIAMLSGALVLSNKLFSKAKQYQETVDKSTEDQIKNLITDTDSLVVIYPTRKTISRKKSDSFGIGVQNIITSTQTTSDRFKIAVNFDKSYDDKEELICDGPSASVIYQSRAADICPKIDFGPDSWINLGNPVKDIRKNELYTFNTLISVPPKTPAGVYIFDVKICEDKIADCFEAQPSQLYDEILHKIYVRVE